jgi:CRP/FNR family transcriptional regulator
MNEDAFQRLVRGAHIERLPPDHILWHDDDGPSLIGVPLDGVLRFERCTSNGRRQILNLFLPGELTGWERQGRSGYTIETATPVTLCRFDPALFDRIMAEDRGLRAAVYRQSDARLERLRWLTWALGALTPEERAAAFLVIGSQFMPFNPDQRGGGLLDVTVSRRDMADLLATTSESICRILKGLERDGVITLDDPRRIRLHSLSELAERGRVARALDRPILPSTARRPRGTDRQDRPREAGLTLVNDAI